MGFYHATSEVDVLRERIEELARIRQGFAAHLGSSLYDATKDNPELRWGRESLYDGMAACDAERDHVLARIADLERGASPFAPTDEALPANDQLFVSAQPGEEDVAFEDAIPYEHEPVSSQVDEGPRNDDMVYDEPDPEPQAPFGVDETERIPMDVTYVQRLSGGPDPLVSPEQGIACPSCGTVCAPGNRYCISCGAALAPEPAANLCPNCGSPTDPSFKFCMSCGHRLA